MRIGMLSMDYPPRMAGGTTVHTYQMAIHFAKLGHRPYVITASHPDAPMSEHGAVEVRRVRRPYTLFSALKAGKMRSELDVVHGHGTCAYGFMKLYRFPTVVKMHSTWLEEFKKYQALGRPTGLMPLYVRMDRYCARNADAVIAISEVIKRETMEYGVPEDKITVIHNGIDPEPFINARSKRDELGFDKDNIVVGYIGRLVPHKGVLSLAKAFKAVAEKHDNARLLVVGDGPERSPMEQILSPLKTRVLFTGYVPHDMVPDYYATTDIIVYPSLYEPLGNVVLEAMAAGKPLIASRTGGIPEIFEERCGIMIEPPSTNNINSLREALETLLSSETMRRDMGRTGQRKVRKYSWDKVCKRTLEVMEGVLRA